METGIIEFLLRTTYVLFGIAVLSILIFAFIQLFQDLKGSVPTITGIAGIGLIFLIAYANTSSAAATAGFSPELISLASAAITSVFFLGGIAIIGIILGEIWTLIK